MLQRVIPFSLNSKRFLNQTNIRPIAKTAKCVTGLHKYLPVHSILLAYKERK